MKKSRPRRTPAPPSATAPPIYCCHPLEFLQPWDHLAAIRRIAKHRIGNATLLSPTFHVGNSEKERRRWKEAFPSLARLVDETPRFEARPQLGMARVFPMPFEFWIEELRLCRDLGLKVLVHPMRRAHLSAEDLARVDEAAGGCVLTDSIMEEDTSVLTHAYPLAKLREMKRRRPALTYATPEHEDPTPDPPALPESADAIDLQMIHDWYLFPYRHAAARARELGAKRLSCIEASAQIRLAMEIGVDVPLLELVPYEADEGLAALRGAAKAYGSREWGVHTALGYYQAPTDARTPERLGIAWNLFYAGGATIFSEPNLALGNTGLCSGFFSERASPPMREGEKEFRGFNDPIVKRGRAVASEFYRFTQFHERPAGGPRVNLGVVMGHLDGYTGGAQSHVWCVDDPAFAAGAPEETWLQFKRLFTADEWYTRPRKYYWQADATLPRRHGTPPCGQVDIVPAEAPLDVLRTYGCLVFLGWNTMTPELYAKLRDYVHAGGRLLMSVPHLSTQLRRDQPPQVINGGDLRDLFGVNVTGPGETIDEIHHARRSACKRYKFATGALYLEEAQLAKVELRGASVLARPRRSDSPVLVEHRHGKGFAWLLTTWEYPGKKLDAFLTDVLCAIAEGEQGDIALEGEGVNYAVYDGRLADGTTCASVYLVNHSIYGQTHTPRLVVRGERIPVRVPGFAMRVGWIIGDLFLSPADRFVKVTGALRTRRGWRITLAAEPGVHRVQLAKVKGTWRDARIDGRACRVERDDEGIASVQFKSRSNATLEIAR